MDSVPAAAQLPSHHHPLDLGQALLLERDPDRVAVQLVEVRLPEVRAGHLQQPVQVPDLLRAGIPSLRKEVVITQLLLDLLVHPEPRSRRDGLEVTEVGVSGGSRTPVFHGGGWVEFAVGSGQGQRHPPHPPAVAPRGQTLERHRLDRPAATDQFGGPHHVDVGDVGGLHRAVGRDTVLPATQHRCRAARLLGPATAGRPADLRADQTRGVRTEGRCVGHRRVGVHHGPTEADANAAAAGQAGGATFPDLILVKDLDPGAGGLRDQAGRCRLCPEPENPDERSVPAVQRL